MKRYKLRPFSPLAFVLYALIIGVCYAVVIVAAVLKGG